MAKNNIISCYHKKDITYFLIDVENELDGIIVLTKNCRSVLSSLYVSSKTYKEETESNISKREYREGEEGVPEEEEEEDFKIHSDAMKILEKMKGNNGNADKWTANQFTEHIRKKFKEAYGIDSFEFTRYDGSVYSKQAKGRIWTIVKQRLIVPFHDSGMSNNDLKNYIDWAYDKKSNDISFPIALELLCKKTMITEWLVDVTGGRISKNRLTSRQKVLKR